MKIAIINLQQAYPVKKSRVREIVREVLRQEDKDAELSIAFVDEDEIRRLNKRFLGKDSPTDVISFPLETKRRWVEGEVVVCVPVA
ncbi:MAG TPA: rRNA maturation RNase YbeY, partial [Candidatus Hypogeohydataceae bacterium YC38]